MLQIVTAVLISMFALPYIAHSEGALAVGRDESGIVTGWAVKRATRDAAYSDALAQCRSRTDYPGPAARCKVVAVFRNQCFAVASDGDSGAVGWGTSEDIRVARNEALTKCGDDDECEISGSACDGPAAPAVKPAPQKKP